MRELFIYYRCKPGDSAAVSRVALDVQRGLCERFPGLEARLLRRPALPSDESVTWMETYRFSAPSSGAGMQAVPAWEQAVTDDAAAALAPWVLGPRHVEIFESLVESLVESPVEPIAEPIIGPIVRPCAS